MTDILRDLGQLRWQDAIDVALLTLVLYRVYIWLRGTIALQVALGMITLVAAAYAANVLGFVLTAYVLQAVSAVSVLVTVVIFRDEIRRALTRASPLRLLLLRPTRRPPERRDFTALAEALFALAGRRLGALVVVARRDPLREHATGGILLDAVASGPLIEALFQKESPLHDGAVVLEGDRLVRAGAFLPLAQVELPVPYGTRHSAAVGLSEVCDALVIVVSEERGEVSLAERGMVAPITDASALARRLAQLSGPEPTAPAPRRPIVRDAIVGAIIFVAVVAAWNLVANQRGATEDKSVAVELRGVPAGARYEPVPSEVTLRMRGPRRVLVGVTAAELHAWADASAVKGTNDVPVAGLGPEGVDVAAIMPSHVSVLERRTVRVEPVLGVRARVLRVDPPEVTLVGKAGTFRAGDMVKTRAITILAPIVRTELVVQAGFRLADDAQLYADVSLDLKP
jgi:uncharacterized protein (TIGR00159 family)